MNDRKRTYIVLMRLLLTFTLVVGGSVDLFAFRSVGKKSFAATVVTGGLPPTNIKIRHTPIIKASPITKQFLILGDAGEDFFPGQPAYEARLKTDSDFGPLTGRLIRVRVLYRFVSSLDPAATAGIPLLETLPIEGGDPVSYAFEIDRSKVTEGFLQYRIVAERLGLVAGSLSVTGGVTFPLTSVSNPEPFITLGVQANASQVFGINGGRFVLPDGNSVDGETALDMPQGLFSGPTTVSIDEIPLASALVPPGLTNPISVYRLDSDAPISGSMKLSLLYPDFLYPFGQDGIVDGTNVPERNLSVVWWDGFVWRRLGGTVNTLANTISVRISFFKFMAIVAAPPLSPEDRRPLEKIITPNGDGINDTVFFSLGDLSENVRVEIFDVTNHPVKTIQSSSTLQWDGRDDNGKIVETGVYIYQYEVDGKRTSGVIGVAK